MKMRAVIMEMAMGMAMIRNDKNKLAFPGALRGL